MKRIIPQYFGSYILSLSVSKEWSLSSYNNSRDVRLILMSLVTGTPMDRMEAPKIAQGERQAIMKATIDAESEIYTLYILNRDLNP